MKNYRHTIRNLDPELIREARILAIQNDATLGQIVSDALEYYLVNAIEWDGEEQEEAA